MDNVLHTFFGLAMARAGVDRKGPLGTAACVIGANLPDVDGAVRWFGDNESYIVHHRGITHSFLGVAVQALALALALAFVARLRRRTGPPFRFLLLWSTLGVLSHLVLDWTNSYGVRPFLPFSEARLFGDLFFIVDPWLWVVLGGALALHSRNTVAGSALWAALFALLLAAMALTGAAPAGAIWVYVACGGLVAAARWRGLGRGRPLVPRIALGAAAAYSLTVFGLRESALAAVRPQIPSGREVAALPLPSDPTRWEILVVGREEFRRGVATSLGGATALSSIPRRLDDPRVQAALATPQGRVFGRFARFPFAEIEPAPGGDVDVVFRDVRFGVAGRRGFGVRTVRVKGGEPGAAGAPRVREVSGR